MPGCLWAPLIPVNPAQGGGVIHWFPTMEIGSICLPFGVEAISSKVNLALQPWGMLGSDPAQGLKATGWSLQEGPSGECSEGGCSTGCQVIMCMSAPRRGACGPSSLAVLWKRGRHVLTDRVPRRLQRRLGHLSTFLLPDASPQPLVQQDLMRQSL